MIRSLSRGMFAALVLMLFASSAEAQTCTVFVTTAGGGSGSSFADATDLSSALPGSSGDVICVAAGTYSPGTNRADTYNIGDGVTVIGGFSGAEAGSVSAADRVAGFHGINPTILDGDYDNDTADSRGDLTSNYNVVTFTANGTLDGVIVEGGNDDRAPSAVNANGVGGGIKVDGGALPGVLNPQIQNAILRNNSSAAAGSSIVGVNAGYTLTNVLITNSGGASSAANVTAAAGGRTGLLAAEADYPITMNNVTIAGNGGQAFFDAEASASATLTVNNSIFYNNALDLPGGSASFQETGATMNDVIFEQESVFCGAGGITCNNVVGTDPNLSAPYDELSFGSIAIDFGDDSNVPVGVTQDGNGGLRIVGASVDAGWVEFVDMNADIALNPASPLNLGSVLDNGATVNGSFDIQNVGQATLNVSAINNNGTAGFAVSGDTPGAIAPGGSQTINVSFTPSVGTTGTQTLSFTINSDDPDEASVSYDVTINVTGAEPDIAANPASLNFGVVQPASSNSLNVTISNEGADLLDVTGVATSGDTEFSTAQGAFQLAPGATQVIAVDFNPATDGTYSGSLDLTSNDPDEGSFSVPLSGVVATSPIIEAVPVPFATTLGGPGQPGDPANGAPTTDPGDVIMVQITVGNATTPVDEFFGVGGELLFDPNFLQPITLAEFELSDNSPQINPDADADPNGTYDLTDGGLSTATGALGTSYVAAGPFISESNTAPIIVFQEMSQVASGVMAFTVVRQAPATDLVGDGVVALIPFRVAQGAPAVGAGGLFQPNFQILDIEKINAASELLQGADAFTMVPSPINIIDRVEVWPGDTDDNGTVEIGTTSDVFPVGQCYQVATNARAAREADWEAKDGLPSAFPAGAGDPCTAAVVENPVFTDANGSGDIDQNDILPVGSNLGEMQSNYPSTSVAQSGAVATVPFQIAPEMVNNKGMVIIDVVVADDFMSSSHGEWLMGFGGKIDLTKVPNAAVSSVTFDARYFDGANVLGPLTTDGNGYKDFSFTATRDASKAEAGWGGVRAVGGAVAQITIEGLSDINDVIEIGLVDLAVSPNGAAPVMIDDSKISLSMSASVANEGVDSLIPTEFALSDAYPNPFGQIATIKYDLPEASEVSVAVFDILGRQVRSLVDGQQAAGSYEVQFDSRGLSSGTYYYVLKAGSYVATRSAVLLK